jgi:lipopolysaccharide/colanic/teichoic acid biosynthesis glycosyltransferase
MSFVGPRPEVPKYVEMFRRDYQEILQVRPGITDLASIEYRDEAAVLGRAVDPEREYVERVLPEKIRLAKEYVRQASFWLDMQIIARTLWLLLRDRLPKLTPEHSSLHASPAAMNVESERHA